MQSLAIATALCAALFTKLVFATNLSNAAEAALDYDRASYVDGLVTEDPFYTLLTPNASEAAPGLLLKLEVQSNTSLFTLPPTNSLSRIIY